MSSSNVTKLILPRGLRIRRGKLHYRFTLAGIAYSGSTGLRATERNVTTAAARMEEIKAKLQRGESITTLVPRRFNEAADQFLSWKEGECKAHPNTWKRINTSLKVLRAFFANVLLHSIKAGHLEDFKQWRRSNNIREVTIRHDLHALSQLFQYANRQAWCFGNPVREVKVPSDADAIRDHVVSPAEEDAYFTAAAAYPLLADVARLILETGMRPGEVLALQAQDVDLRAQKLVVRRGKTKAARRVIALRPAAVAVLERRMPTSGAVFVGPRGARRNLGTSIVGMHSRVLAKTKMAFTLYEFRHTFASRLAEDGCPVPTIAAILGHASLRMVHRYIHPSQAAQEDAIHRYGTRSKVGPSPTAPDGSRESASESLTPAGFGQPNTENQSVTVRAVGGAGGNRTRG